MKGSYLTDFMIGHFMDILSTILPNIMNNVILSNLKISSRTILFDTPEKV